MKLAGLSMSLQGTQKYEGWLISKVSYREVSLVVGRTKRLRMRSVVDTV